MALVKNSPRTLMSIMDIMELMMPIAKSQALLTFLQSQNLCAMVSGMSRTHMRHIRLGDEPSSTRVNSHHLMPKGLDKSPFLLIHFVQDISLIKLERGVKQPMPFSMNDFKCRVH